MNKLLVATCAALACAVGSPALAQTPAGVTRPVPPSGPAGGAPRELPSNQESGVEIDRFIGTPGPAFAKIFNGLMTRSMLRKGDPYSPGPSGAVLEYRDDLSLATLEPHLETRIIDTPQVIFYYVQGGVGRMDSGPGTKSYDLRNGVGMLIAPNAKHRFLNTGDQQLSMIMLSWTDNEGLTVKLPIKVVDANTIPLNSNRAHWVHSGRNMFGVNDGVNITISPILFPPVTYAGPHAHIKSVEEIWVKVGEDVNYAILGSEIRKIDGVGAFLSPPNGLTTHSSMNLNEDRSSIWLYLSRRLPQQPAPAPVPAR